jgi:hypothetical protein
MALRLLFYFNTCGGLDTWIDYGCPQDGVACDQGTVRVDVCFGVPRRPIRSDVCGIIRGCINGYGGVRVLVGLAAVGLGGVF